MFFNASSKKGSYTLFSGGSRTCRSVQRNGSNFGGARFQGCPDQVQTLRAECPRFKCPPNAQTCCCRRLLYNQPDFANVETILETTCRARGCDVLFLPKFHCELNFIEQCWGYTKRVYRLNPPSSREDQLEKNTLAALEAVPLKSMRKFANRSRRFMDAY